MTVYFIRMRGTDLYKIGWTQALDARVRLYQLQTASPFALDLVATFPGLSRRIESEVHGLLADERLRGEWFELGNPCVLGSSLDWMLEGCPAAFGPLVDEARALTAETFPPEHLDG